MCWTLTLPFPPCRCSKIPCAWFPVLAKGGFSVPPMELPDDVAHLFKDVSL